MRITIGAVAVLAAVACGGGTDAGSDPIAGCTESSAVETNAVALAGTIFSPSCVKVRTGGAITFTAADATIHTVTTDGGQAVSFDSGNLSLGETYTRTFTTPGTVNVHCAFHVAMGMRARIFVHD